MKSKIISILVVILLLLAVLYYWRFYAKKSINNAPIIPVRDISQPINTNSTELKKISYEEYLQQGINYESTSELDKAIGAYKKAAEVLPTAYVPYSNLGSIYEHNKEFSKAEEAFKTALSIDPQSVSVYRKLYELYRYDLKQNSQEITLFFKDALKQTNNSIDLTKLYASYLEDINNLESALIVWKAFLQAEPNNEIYAAKIKSLEEKIAR